MTKKINIFCDNADSATLEQFNSAVEQPDVIAAALMPDAHAGYSLPIGSVIKTESMVFPSWVGYDIGCTDGETEFLTQTGWKKISEYDGEDILVYNHEKNISYFDKPVNYVKKQCDLFYHLKNSAVDQMLNGEHRIPLFSTRNNGLSVDFLDNLIVKNSALKKGINKVFKNCVLGYVHDESLFSDDDIRLIIAISADGTIRKSGLVEFHLKKERKIDRLKSLLLKMNIPLTVYDTKDGTFSCGFKYLKATKSLKDFWGLSKQQYAVLIDEVVYWDGHIAKDGQKNYSSTDKENIDVVQFAFSVCGVRANVFVNNYDNENWKTGYSLYCTNNDSTCFPKPSQITKTKSKDGFCYCFTTKTSYWYMRRGNKIVLTGNCGVCAAPLDIEKDFVVKNADLIFDSLYNQIPVGFKCNPYPLSGLLVHEEFTLSDEIRQQVDNQVGTLGSGNHFIEIGYDEQDKVWVVIHSGSRHLGHDVASHYMKLAAKSDKPLEGHYGFDIHSIDGMRYLTDMDFCLKFALLNREIMAVRVGVALNNPRIVDLENMINRNHNHAEVTHDGVIHRKGATHAEKDMMGVIPANMRDGAFIVRGKGYEPALCSSSHGCGRIMGRNQAKKNLSQEEFESSMVGIKSRLDVLDESPMAYKNYNHVMEQQSEMIDIVSHIKPIINIKG